eukprot:m.484949 g.484949  ORF g.484949 m.484949 type:complete len:375 (+) comp23604_c0_seq1:115-1239(+)
MACLQTVFAVGVVLAVVSGSHAASRFNCTVGAAPPLPKNITQLHPAHVSVVMAMGDSITAAFAARATVLEARDISWSIGVGSADQLTLPYIMGHYTSNQVPHLAGMSTTAVLPNGIEHLPHGDYHEKTDNLNVAESEGAVHRNSLEEQWQLLQNQFKNYPDLPSRWKVLTLWMTANDVCDQCDHPMNTTDWTRRTDELLYNVSKSLNNVYVNLVSTLDLSNVARIQRSVEFCKLEHKLLNECGCIDRGNASKLAMLDQNVHALNHQLHVLAEKWQTNLAAQGRTDMAVVVQSYQEGIGASLDFRFLNDLDCFHPSAVGHEDLAIGLWNSMLCVKDRKNRCHESFTPDLPVTCPTTDSVFYTGPDVIPGPPPKGM